MRITFKEWAKENKLSQQDINVLKKEFGEGINYMDFESETHIEESKQKLLDHFAQIYNVNDDIYDYVDWNSFYYDYTIEYSVIELPSGKILIKH